MTYFKILSLGLGVLMLGGGLWVIFFKDAWERIFFRIYPEARPSWVPAAGSLVLLWVLWTWAEFFKATTMPHFVVTLVVSLGLVKVAPFIFFYRKTRDVLKTLAGETLAFRVVMLSSAAIGFALLVHGFFF